ncbi:MAG TPA: radical SAM protein [Candidatus Rifleibacterium sp.]|nr:radical SAM protein [Candidatus Rifleibacterium sp.]HPT46034.1 radical SAM protein [Candidatus Rifleibacterium sp.]
MDKRWAFFTVDFELTNICAQNCLFCPRHGLTRPAGFVSPDLFASLARQLAAAGSRLTFCGMGNPLLHPALEEIAAICHEHGLYYGLTVQAPALDLHGLAQIALLRPAFIEISFPTTDPALFSKIYPGQSMQDAIEGLHNLARQRNGTRGMVINAVTVATEAASHVEISRFWQTEGFECRIQLCHSRGGNLLNTELVNAVARPVNSCGLFATHAFITWQGHLLACCHDLSGITQVADLTEITVTEAATRKLAILEHGMPFSICRNCDEPAASRPIPDRPFPESAKARSRFLKNHCQHKSP